MNTIKVLPRTLHQLIADTLSILDDVIREQGGNDFYRQLKGVQGKMSGDSYLPVENWQEVLKDTYQQLGDLSAERKGLLVRSFTLMIESVNACETAYRTYRLSKKKSSSELEKSTNTIVFVLTAHPTEARSPANILLFQHVHHSCLELLKGAHRQSTQQRLKHLLKLAWFTPVARHRRPEVLDEAESIFSTILRDDILDELILLRQQGVDIRIRTWVGGDKDGHPGVNEKVMLKVMSYARKRYLKVIETKLQLVMQDLKLIEFPFQKIQGLLKKCLQSLSTLSVLKFQDCLNLIRFKENFALLKNSYQEQIGMLHPELAKITSLLQLFPALLIPLELREEAREIHRALHAEKPAAITRMLQSVARICQYTNVEYYIKGLIISMTETEHDIEAGLLLVKRIFDHKNIRVVPLFETESALTQAAPILEKFFKQAVLLQHVKTTWDNRFEVMLGYSDSAKGMGVLPSRLSIANTMRAIDLLCKTYQITPIFFHGSGGSIDRGGGSIEEQTAWWPQSSFLICKTTLQGEMVERSFASRFIMTRMINKLLRESQKKHHQRLRKNKIVEKFAQEVSHHYQEQLKDPFFLEMVSKATSYQLLDKLKFGSRPVKREKTLSVDSLRAIPWVLCWTQTRILFPTWWGIGSAWQKLKPKDRLELQTAYAQHPLFRSFIKLLGFTLAKVDLSIWRMYLNTSNLDKVIREEILQRFEREYKLACEAVLGITQQHDLLWFRPWLQESIALRAPFIHPLNLLQIHAIKENDAYLIRETTTGIAAGMLTTG